MGGRPGGGVTSSFAHETSRTSCIGGGEADRETGMDCDADGEGCWCPSLEDGAESVLLPAGRK